jgi:hypothetical protein
MWIGSALQRKLESMKTECANQEISVFMDAESRSA